MSTRWWTFPALVFVWVAVMLMQLVFFFGVAAAVFGACLALCGFVAGSDLERFKDSR